MAAGDRGDRRARGPRARQVGRPGLRRRACRSVRPGVGARHLARRRAPPLAAGPYARAGARARIRAGREPRLRGRAHGGRADRAPGAPRAVGRGGLRGPPGGCAPRAVAPPQQLSGRRGSHRARRPGPGRDLPRFRSRPAARSPSRSGAADRALLGDSADNPKALEGKVVRVRGWIERRSGAFDGPVIDLSAGGLIEVLETAAEGRPSAPSVWARHRRSAGAWRYSGSQRPELGQDRHIRSPGSR